MAEHQIQCIYGLWQLRRLVPENGRTASYHLKSFSDEKEAQEYATEHGLKVVQA